MSNVITLDLCRYALNLPQGRPAEVLLVPVVKAAGQALMLQHEIVVDRGYADSNAVKEVLDRVAPHLQGGWSPHVRPDSWIGTIHGEASNASTAIEALGDLYLLDEEGGEAFLPDFVREAELKERTLETVRRELWQAAHDGMFHRSLGYYVGATERWALENSSTL